MAISRECVDQSYAKQVEQGVSWSRENKPNVFTPQKGFEFMYQSSIGASDAPESLIGKFWRERVAIPIEMTLRHWLVVNESKSGTEGDNHDK